MINLRAGLIHGRQWQEAIVSRRYDLQTDASHPYKMSLMWCPDIVTSWSWSKTVCIVQCQNCQSSLALLPSSARAEPHVFGTGPGALLEIGHPGLGASAWGEVKACTHHWGESGRWPERHLDLYNKAVPSILCWPTNWLVKCVTPVWKENVFRLLSPRLSVCLFKTVLICTKKHRTHSHPPQPPESAITALCHHAWFYVVLEPKALCLLGKHSTN